MKRLNHAIFALITAVVTLLASSAAAGDSVRLHQRIAAPGPQVHLSEIAELSGSAADALKDLVVGQFADEQATTTITLEHIAGVLTDAGVNWARLSLAGCETCTVERLADLPAAPAIDAENPTLFLANPAGGLSVDGPLTIGEKLTAFIHELTDIDSANLRITFADGDQPLLSQPVLSDRFEFEPMAQGIPGRLPITIRRYRDDQPVQTDRVRVDVEQRYLAVVTVQPIQRRQALTYDDVQIREVYIGSAGGKPMTDVDAVVGQVCTTSIRAGEVVLARHLQPPRLVRRGEYVTVRCFAGNLVIKTVARAMQDGSIDDVIRVRNQASGGDFYVRVTGRRLAESQGDPNPSTQEDGK